MLKATDMLDAAPEELTAAFSFLHGGVSAAASQAALKGTAETALTQLAHPHQPRRSLLRRAT
jgi:hypothetical protein